jgi:hypothetical protein
MTIYIKTGKVNECQGNGITLDSIKTRIKSGWALSAPPPPPAFIGLKDNRADGYLFLNIVHIILLLSTADTVVSPFLGIGS